MFHQCPTDFEMMLVNLQLTFSLVQNGVGQLTACENLALPDFAGSQPFKYQNIQGLVFCRGQLHHLCL